MKTLKELLGLAEERVNEILDSQGRIDLYTINDIWNDVVQEDREQLVEALRNGDVTFSDCGWSKE